MKRRIIFICGIVILVLGITFLSIFLYKKEQERQKKLEQERIETRYKEVFNNAYKIINSNDEEIKEDAKTKDEELIYGYFENIDKEKDELSLITYENFLSANPLVNIFNNPSEYSTKIDEYNNNFNTKKQEYLNVSKDLFIDYLKTNGCSKKGLSILKKKIKNDDIKIDANDINNIETNNINQTNVIKEYINYLNQNKNNWYLKNGKILCKNNDVLNFIIEKNKTLGINIVTEKEPVQVTYKKIPVIMYHGVSDTTWGLASLFMRVKDFEEQMKYLHDNGYETIFLEDIEKNYSGKKVVALTFDDGYVDFYTNILPIIKKYNIKTNLYIISGSAMSGNEKYVNGAQVKEISNSGLVSIGSHTATHSALANLSEERIETELRDSKNYLENLLGKEIKTISYPTGSYNSKVIEIAKKYYKYGITTKAGVQVMSPGFSKFEIKRYGMYRDSGLSTFKGMVSNAN